MRVSDYFNLGRSQPTLEFVDVDIEGDVRVYVDPRAFRFIDSTWAAQCVSLLQSFFTTVLESIQLGDHDRARMLLASLTEPNETRLGLSRDKARGRGMGRDLAEAMWKQLHDSRAVSSGLLEDLEDTVLFVDYIGFDIISDITTNIVREPLIDFTHDACDYYGIPLTPDVASGRIWQPRSKEWTQEYVSLPITPHGPLLLVPKAIVRRSATFDPGEYYNHYILPYLQEQEMRAGSSLVEVLKSGRRRVTKKSIREKYGVGKHVNLDTTLKNPSLLDGYRAVKSRPQLPPGHSEMAALTNTPEPDWKGLLEAVTAISAGQNDADAYHRSVEALLSALFYPALIDPKREHKIHQGRKRIDILYTNDATHGFFHWVHATHGTPCGFVPVECKNYGSELGNPEFDQLAGRFSIQRGRLGFLCHRGYGNKQLVIQRCRDAALDGRGYIIALDDGDLAQLADYREKNPDAITFPYLYDRFRELI
jgi:hypothetical protein